MRWLNFLDRKEVLFSPRTPKTEMIRWGDEYIKSDRLYEAAAFYRQAKYSEGLQRIRLIAVEAGDFFLFRESEDPTTPSKEEEELLSLAQRAEALGRWHDARKAYERLDDPRGLQRAQDALRELVKEAEERS